MKGYQQIITNTITTTIKIMSSVVICFLRFQSLIFNLLDNYLPATGGRYLVAQRYRALKTLPSVTVSHPGIFKRTGITKHITKATQCKTTLFVIFLLFLFVTNRYYFFINSKLCIYSVAKLIYHILSFWRVSGPT